MFAKFARYAVGVAIVAGCSGTDTPAPKAEPDRPEPVLDPIYNSDSMLDMENAEMFLAKIKPPLSTSHPLYNPKDPRDVLEVLKTDQVDLFPRAVPLVAHEHDRTSIALHSQILLAWGEANMVLSEQLLKIQRIIDARRLKLAQKEVTQLLSKSEKWQLKNLEVRSLEIDRLVEAFQVLSGNQVQQGIKRAHQLMSARDRDYVGYRLAADYHRMMHQWDDFATMLGRTEELKPDSNGVVFLKGAAAFQRDQDYDTAAQYYRQALANDPKFVRAQAHLVLMQSDMDGMRKELANLRKLNPDHQLVFWATPYLAALE